VRLGVVWIGSRGWVRCGLVMKERFGPEWQEWNSKAGTESQGGNHGL
jgi:hypothetical protein